MNTLLPKSESKLLDDLSAENLSTIHTSETTLNSDLLVKQLQEELNVTKEHLLDQQTKYLQTQTKHRKEIDDTTNNFNNSVKEFQVLMKQSLAQQRELLTHEFKVLLQQQAAEYELKMNQKIKDLKARHEAELDRQLEDKLVNFQERMIVNQQSELQDIDVKIRKIVAQSVKEENLVEKARLKQNFEQIEKELKNEAEKHVQICFKNQSEVFKEQIKSGIQQEHLIHKDLINNKLEKLFRSSEEKRRATNLLFNRHMSGLNFFFDNARKQLGIINQAQNDLLKNRDIVDYYGDINNNNNSNSTSGNSSGGLSISSEPVIQREASEEEIDELLLKDLL